MKRLTRRGIDEPTWVPNEEMWCVDDEFGARSLIGEVVDRLAEYEDIGFTPLEIKYMLQCGARAAGFPLENCIPEEGVTEKDIEE